MHSGVDQRLHQQEDIGRSAATDGGRPVEKPFVSNVELLPERTQNSARLLPLGVRHRVGSGPDGHPFTDLCRGVGHRPDDRRVPQARGDRRDTSARHNRHHQGRRTQDAIEIGTDRREDLGLDRQHHDAGFTDGGAIVPCRVDVEEIAHLFQTLRVQVGGGDGAWFDELVPQEAADHRLAHRPRTDKGDRHIVQYLGPFQEPLLCESRVEPILYVTTMLRVVPTPGKLATWIR